MSKKKISLIIPCFNEEESLSQLFEKILPLAELFLNIEIIFVDDGSTDNTKKIILQWIKGKEDKFKLVAHDKNMNLGAALKTGVEHSSNSEIVCFLDSDCTYDPKIIEHLVQEIENGFDIVTVSPYHPRGSVEGVPKWRLFLSFGCSFIYRTILRKKIYTWTAMVRAIKSEHIDNIQSEKNDFSYVAEVMINGVKNNLKILEVPTILHVRKYGQSKMNIIKTIKSHLKIIKYLLLGR